MHFIVNIGLILLALLPGLNGFSRMANFNFMQRCGLLTKNNESPWLVAIYNEEYKFVATGTIITSFHLLSATSTSTFPREKQYVVPGSHPRNYNVWRNLPQTRKIKSWEKIPITGTSRFILITVDREFSCFGENHVHPVCLDFNLIYRDLHFQDGSQGFIVEWEQEQDDIMPSKLGNQSNAVYWKTDTLDNNGILNSFPLWRSVLYVEHINSNNSIFNKNEGLALVFRTNERYFLRGILISDISQGFVTPFINVMNFADWIQKIVPDRFSNSFYQPDSWYTGCILPENIENGRFTLTTGAACHPGWRMRPMTTILLFCADNTNIHQPLHFLCVNDTWSPSIEKASCRKPGTCPSIPTTTYQEAICKLNGGIVDCGSPPINSIASVRCKPFYTYPIDRPIYKCHGGEWDQPIIPCTLECGIKRTKHVKLIIGEDEVEVDEYPWVVIIYNSGKHICGGSLISRKFVLSVAHCFTTEMGDLHDISNFTVAAGKRYRDIEREEASAQERKVKAVHIHEDYKGRIHKYKDDIALIEVVEDFVPAWEVEPVCIDWDSAYEIYDFTHGTIGSVTGWENTTDGEEPSPILKKLVVQFKNNSACEEALPQTFWQEYWTSDKICAGYKNKNASLCRGDSGGGLYFQSNGDRHFIRGITSLSMKSGIGCDANQYTLYTKVSMHLEWIESITRRIL